MSVDDWTEPVNLAAKLNTFSDHWKPRIVAELNGQHVKVARLKGEFPWHHHEHEDELFLVISGRLVLRLENREVVLRAGELFVVPKGVSHSPYAEGEVQVLLFEPAGTLNTGNLRTRQTVDAPERI